MFSGAEAKVLVVLATRTWYVAVEVPIVTGKLVWPGEICVQFPVVPRRYSIVSSTKTVSVNPLNGTFAARGAGTLGVKVRYVACEAGFVLVAANAAIA